MVQQQSTVFLVDDDPAVNRAFASVGQVLGLPVAAFASAGEFLKAYDLRPGCLVLNLQLPGMSGLELQRHLADDDIRLPIVMTCDHADVRLAVEVMTRGAVTLLEKPVRLDELVAQVRRALELNAADRVARVRQAEAEARLVRLTPKEREVFELIVAGKSNKHMAAELRLSLRAVEDRRARLMKKLQVRSLAELVQLRLPMV